MRYHYEKPDFHRRMYGELYFCDHPVYSRCTLFKSGEVGLAVIRQRFNKSRKTTWWCEIEDYLANDIYLNPNFREYFKARAGKCVSGLYPTVTVRQIMWALKMKPLKKEVWETVFDRNDI